MQQGWRHPEAGAPQPIDGAREVHQATLCSQVEDSKQPGDVDAQGARSGTGRLVVHYQEVGLEVESELDRGALTAVKAGETWVGFAHQLADVKPVG